MPLMAILDVCTDDRRNGEPVKAVSQLTAVNFLQSPKNQRAAVGMFKW